MTSATVAASTAHATHADGLAIFEGVLGVLELAGWTRLRVDTLVHPDALLEDKQWVVRHHFTAGRWEFEFRPDPQRWQDAHQPCRTASIDRRRPPLSSIKAVVSQLFGGERMALAAPRATDNATHSLLTGSG